MISATLHGARCSPGEVASCAYKSAFVFVLTCRRSGRSRFTTVTSCAEYGGLAINLNNVDAFELNVKVKCYCKHEHSLGTADLPECEKCVHEHWRWIRTKETTRSTVCGTWQQKQWATSDV